MVDGWRLLYYEPYKMRQVRCIRNSNADRRVKDLLRRDPVPELLAWRGGEPCVAGDREPDDSSPGAAPLVCYVD